MQILGIIGSLRRESVNGKLLRAAEQCLPAGAKMIITGCGDLPHYNSDLTDKPEPVVRLLQLVNESDGLLIASPEYNFSIPGVLKNAIDWVSRPAYKSVLAGKPTAVISASPSLVGGARMQSHIREILAGTLTPVVPAPPFLVPTANDKFAADGRLADPDTLRRLERYMQEFVDWIKLLNK